MFASCMSFCYKKIQVNLGLYEAWAGGAEAESHALSCWLSASASLGPVMEAPLLQDEGKAAAPFRPQTATCPELLPWLVHSTCDGGTEMSGFLMPSRSRRLISGEE